MNKAISTPLAIGIILVMAIIIGGITCWQYTNIISKKGSEIELSGKKGREDKKEGISFKEAIKECENFILSSLLTTEGLESEEKEYLEDYLSLVCIKPLCDSFKTTEEKIQTCNREENVDERDTCLLSIFPLTVEVCDSVSDSTYTRNSPKTRCYCSIAEKKEDDSICDKINDDIGQRVECYKTVASIKKDPKICQKIDYNYFKNWCSDNPKINLCEYDLGYWNELSFKDSFDKYKNSCLGMAMGDISKCGDKENSEKYYCYVEVAKFKNDLSICEKITPTGYEYIKDYCILSVAELRKDSSLCDKINDFDYKSSCYLSTTDEIDVDFCRRKSLSMDACYTALALQEKDISLCSKVISHPEICSFAFVDLMREQVVKLNKNLDEEDQSLYNQYCEAEFKSRTIKENESINKAKEILKKTDNIDGAIEECKTLEMEWEYSECVANLAIMKKDSSICKDFVNVEENTNGYIRYLCYEHFAVETNDISVCALVENWSFREKCYTIMAVKNNDKSICNLIEEREDFDTKYSRSMCPNYVGRATVEELLGIY